MHKPKGQGTEKKEKTKQSKTKDGSLRTSKPARALHALLCYQRGKKLEPKPHKDIKDNNETKGFHFE